jgi:hypothetical protein
MSKSKNTLTSQRDSDSKLKLGMIDPISITDTITLQDLIYHINEALYHLNVVEKYKSLLKKGKL